MDTGPANTVSYMISGYVVIFGIIFLYIASLLVRTRNLQQEEEMLINLEQE